MNRYNTRLIPTLNNLFCFSTDYNIAIDSAVIFKRGKDRNIYIAIKKRDAKYCRYYGRLTVICSPHSDVVLGVASIINNVPLYGLQCKL